MAGEGFSKLVTLIIFFLRFLVLLKHLSWPCGVSTILYKSVQFPILINIFTSILTCSSIISQTRSHKTIFLIILKEYTDFLSQ